MVSSSSCSSLSLLLQLREAPSSGGQGGLPGSPGRPGKRRDLGRPSHLNGPRNRGRPRRPHLPRFRIVLCLSPIGRLSLLRIRRSRSRPRRRLLAPWGHLFGRNGNVLPGRAPPLRRPTASLKGGRLARVERHPSPLWRRCWRTERGWNRQYCCPKCWGSQRRCAAASNIKGSPVWRVGPLICVDQLMQDRTERRFEGVHQFRSQADHPRHGFRIPQKREGLVALQPCLAAVPVRFC